MYDFVVVKEGNAEGDVACHSHSLNDREGMLRSVFVENTYGSDSREGYDQKFGVKVKFSVRVKGYQRGRSWESTP